MFTNGDQLISSEKINSKDMTTDFGLLFGFLLGNNFKFSYYHGIPNILKESSQSTKVQNSVFEFSMYFF